MYVAMAITEPTYQELAIASSATRSNQGSFNSYS